MWAPVDITTIPTAKEFFDAKSAIEQVETELKDALLSLEQAQRRVVNLEKELKERRRWIAPIRRLSYDVLSLIFEFCGEDNWRTPLRISGVSRLWRTLVLATPRAWAFLHVHECDDDEHLIRHFFQHSGQRPLHVFLSESQHLTVPPEVTKRLECLSVEEYSQLEGILVFPKLERLSLRSVDERVGLSNICIARFPALRELICEPVITTSFPSSIKATFPPLQCLSIAIHEDAAWLELLIGCQSNLVSLRLHNVDNFHPDSKQQILLPMLRCLEIHLWHHYPDTWPMDMRTPALEIYIELCRECAAPAVDASPVHEAVGTVTQIRMGHRLNLSTMTLLRVIQLKLDIAIAEALFQLQANRSLCPGLEIIEVIHAGDLPPIEASLFEVNKERSQPISIRSVKTFALPYEILPSPVSSWFSTYIPTDISSSAGGTCLAVESNIRPPIQSLTPRTRSPYPPIKNGSDALGVEGEK